MVAGAYSGAHRRGNQRPGGHAGRARERLLHGSVLLLGAASARPRPLVLPANVQVSQVFLLQELRLHALSLLVRVLLRILGSGENIGLVSVLLGTWSLSLSTPCLEKRPTFGLL